MSEQNDDLNPDWLREEFQRVLEWFDVDRYIDAKSFGVKEWYFVLSRRAISLEIFPKTKRLEIVRYVIETPLLTQGPFTSDIFPRTVRDVSVLSAWIAKEIISANEMAREACEAWEKLSNEGDPTPLVSDEEKDEWLIHAATAHATPGTNPIINSGYSELLALDGLSQASYVFAEIDLYAPDSTIINDFKTWLHEKRTSITFARSPVRLFSEKELGRWGQQKILPYIDLMMAMREFGVTLPNHQIGEILFPNVSDVDVAEKVRKTVAPLAAEALSCEMREALQRAANAIRIDETE